MDYHVKIPPSSQVEMGVYSGFLDEWRHFPTATDKLLIKSGWFNLGRLQDTEISIKIGYCKVDSLHVLDAAKEFVQESFEWIGAAMPVSDLIGSIHHPFVVFSKLCNNCCCSTKPAEPVDLWKQDLFIKSTLKRIMPSATWCIWLQECQKMLKLNSQ